MDEALVGDNPPTSIKEGIMTTWHAEESLADATEYFFCLTLPDEHLVSECKTALILSGIADQMRELKNLVNRYLKTVPEEYGNGLI